MSEFQRALWRKHRRSVGKLEAWLRMGMFRASIGFRGKGWSRRTGLMVTQVNVNLQNMGGLILKNSQKEVEHQISF